MEDIKIKKYKPIMKIFRNVLGIPIEKLTYQNGKQIHGIHRKEHGTLNPSPENVLAIARALEIKPDILLYAYGYFPKKEKEIIASDPFYYREKIVELCNNHANRYELKVDLDLLNIRRVADYIENNRVERTKKSTRRTENDKNE